MTSTETSNPTGDVIYGSFWPASVLFAESGEAWHRCRVYLGSRGLTVYRTRPRPGLEDHADFQAPFLLEATPEPNWSTRHVGVDIATKEGLVVVTPMGGCGCGSTLKAWAGPSYSKRIVRWPAS